jgi:hypothetical protein
MCVCPKPVVREDEKTVALASVQLEKRTISLDAIEDATTDTQPGRSADG